VGRHEALLLLDLLLEALLLQPAVAGALRQTFTQLGVLGNLGEHLVALIKEAESEGSEAKLDDGAVEGDLVGNLLAGNSGVNLGTQEEVLSLVVSVVDGVVVHLQEDGLDLELVGALLDHVLNNFLDFLLRVFEEVELSKFLRLSLELLLCSSIERILLVVNMFKLD